MDRVAGFLVNHRKRVLGLTAVTTLLAVACMFRMQINADVTHFMLDGNEAGRQFAALQEKYEAGDPIMVLLRRDAGWEDKAGLGALIEARDVLTSHEGVAEVGSLIPEVHPLTGERFDAATLAATPPMMLSRLLDGPSADLLLSEDGKATMMVVLAEDDASKLARQLEDVTWPDGVTVRLAGNPVVLATIIGSLTWFVIGIPPVVIILLLLVFAANIGNRKLAVASIVPAILGSIWTFGLIFGLGFDVDIITMIVPVFVIVMGSADGLHFVTHLQEAAQRTDDRTEQTASALRQVGVPMILTTVSTAAGFLSLVATDVGPIRQLGLFVAIGIVFAGVVSFFSLPAALSTFELPPPSPHAIGHRATGLLKKVARHRIVAVLLFVGLVTFAALTVPKLGMNSDQLFFFDKDHPVRASFEEMTEVFGGATPLFGELVVDPDRPLADQAAELREVQAELAALPAVRKVFSVLDITAAAPPAMRDAVLTGERSGPMGRMVTQDGLRFVLFPGEFDSEELQGWLAWADGHELVRVLTGMPVLYDEMSRLVFSAQVRSLSTAFVLVFLMLLVAYRKIGATLQAMLPLALTCAVLLGFLAVSGIHLHLLTATVTAIVIGVGVDYAIHLVAAIEHARKDGPGYALRAIDTAGRPIIANALGVAVGMTALMLSPFAPHTHISLVMWVSMTTAALTALVLIPALCGRAATTPPA